MKNNTIIKHSYIKKNNNKDTNKKLINNSINNPFINKTWFIVFDSTPAIQYTKGNKIRINNKNPILPLSTPAKSKLLPQQREKGIKEKK